MPFEPFHTEDGKPLGVDAEEACHVAYAVTEYALGEYDVSNTVDCLRAKRTAKSTDQAYSHLVALADSDVLLEDVEKELGFKLAVPERAHPVFGTDPYCVLRMRHAVQVSLCKYVNSVDLVCGSLSGLAQGQTAWAVEQDVVCAKNEVVCELTDLLVAHATTSLDVNVAIDELTARHTKVAVDAHKDRVGRAVCGVLALERVFESAGKAGIDLEQAVQSDYNLLQEICALPPPQLEEQMRINGVAIHVLSSCFVDPALSVVGSSMLRPSLGRIAHMLNEFFQTTGDAFKFACSATLMALRKELAHAADADVWHSVTIEPAGSQRAQELAGLYEFDAVHSLPVPTHTSAGLGHVVAVVDPKSFSGLRAARMLKVISLCASKLHLLRPRAMKASIVLASLARFRSEASHCTGLQMQPRPSRAKMARTSGASSQGMPLALQTEFVPRNIDPAMDRDYQVLVALLRSLPRASGTVTLKMVCEGVRRLGGSFSEHRDGSLKQVTAFVVKRAVDKAERACKLDEFVVEYMADKNGYSGGTYIRMDVPGCNALKGWLRAMIARIERGDANASRDWHASRSSKSRAKAQKLTGQPPKSRSNGKALMLKSTD